MSQQSLKEILSISPVIPVVVIENKDDALPLANALLDGGVKIMEITLRSNCALDAIKKIRANLPKMTVGAGTVNNIKLLEECIASDVQFVVSPGATQSLIDAVKKNSVNLLPGAITPSEVLSLLDNDINIMKFFPAEAAGGVNMLKSLAGPLPDVTFCPTGGIDDKNFQSYLSLPNVDCVGSSWLVDKNLVASKNWGEITRRAKSVFG